MLVTAPNEPSPITGRPRDSRIDDAVLRAAAQLLREVGYLQLTMGAIAERAGTNKPAIYRRWPTKAHLVHEAVFPALRRERLPVGGDLRGDIRALVTVGVDLLGSPEARAALPGLLAEMNDHPTLRADVLGRFADAAWGWLQQRLEDAIRSGAVRADLQPSTVLEVIAGSAMVATLLRPRDELGSDWIENVVDLILHGIAKRDDRETKDGRPASHRHGLRTSRKRRPR